MEEFPRRNSENLKIFSPFLERPKYIKRKRLGYLAKPLKVNMR